MTSEERLQAEKVFDQGVGERVRSARHAAKMNQSELAHQVGVTFQQVQKYENGANRISASRMSLIAQALGVTNAHLMGEGEPGVSKAPLTADIVRLISSYHRCGPSGQKAIRDLAASLDPL